MRILLLSGPNLNLLGTREPEVYGTTTLPQLEAMCRTTAEGLGHHLEAYQSNHEGALIDAIHGARGVFDGIVFNPGAYTHTSYALHDAIEAVEIPTVEIHISNVRAREPWRRVSRIGPACVYQIFGRGIDGYTAALRRLHHLAMSPPTTVSYGPADDQHAEVRVTDASGPQPTVVLVHGGFWREQYTLDTLDALAIDLIARGFTTVNLEYRRIPPIGGWRTTMADVTAGLEAAADLDSVDAGALTVLGHSAGGHLGFFAARDSGAAVRSLVTLGGVMHLDTLPEDHDALPNFLGDELAAHRSTVDPSAQVPVGVPTLVVHGDQDESVSVDHGRRYAEAASAAGDEVELLELAGSDHWDVIDPASDAWAQIAGRLDAG